ncbi:MAG: hypothetical protein LBC20_08980 [Planctomycetaceae bacterium]|nr:hypothetical protein [Planctomycetaceae bacterium]
MIRIVSFRFAFQGEESTIKMPLNNYKYLFMANPKVSNISPKQNTNKIQIDHDLFPKCCLPLDYEPLSWYQ